MLFLNFVSNTSWKHYFYKNFVYNVHSCCMWGKLVYLNFPAITQNSLQQRNKSTVTGLLQNIRDNKFLCTERRTLYIHDMYATWMRFNERIWWIERRHLTIGAIHGEKLFKCLRSMFDKLPGGILGHRLKENTVSNL